ncbi:hypothetical protein MMC17_006544 [Xylographa soralifera]|nr:hypothetical protein [Xylographa soralifera]
MTSDSAFLRLPNTLLLLTSVCGVVPLVTSQWNDLLSARISAVPSQHWDGNDGLWYTFLIYIGNPAQDVRVHVSTSTSVLWLPNHSTKHSITTDVIDYIGECGISFDKDASTTWHSRGQAGAGDYSVEDVELLPPGNFYLGLGKDAQFGSDFVTLRQHDMGELTLKHEAVVSSAEDHYSIGSLGLAPRIFNFIGSQSFQPSTMHHFPEERNTLGASYGYTAGAVYKEEPVYGSLTLGGYDTARIGVKNLTFDLWPGIPQDLHVSIEAITTGNRFEEVFDLAWNEESNLYLVNETLHETLLTRNASITFTLSNERSKPNSTVDIVLPYASFDLTASYPLVADAATYYFPLRRAENETQFTLGRTFLQEAYLTVDYERSLFSISQASFPDPRKSQPIVPIYRPSNVVSWPGISEYELPISIALLSYIVQIVLILYGLYVLWPKSVSSHIPGQRLGTVHIDVSAMLRMSRHPPLVEEDIYTDSFAIHQASAFLSELESVPSSLILILPQKRPGTINQLKVYIEVLTGVEWDWWPLRPRERALLPGYSRIRWSCACGEEISKDVLTAIADRLDEIISLQRTKARITSRASGERPVGQQDTSSALTTTSSDSNEILDSYIRGFDDFTPNPPGYTNTVRVNSMNTILKREMQDRSVFLGITKANNKSLAQINVKDHEDDAFFECLKTEYKKCRGLIRRLLGIWRYSHYDFVKFEKFADREFALLCHEVPDPTNKDYHYTPKPVTHNPPISPHEFRSRFYKDRKCYLPSKVAITHYNHRCKTQCRSSREALARIPKNVFPLEEEGHGREYFWGIHAVEQVSFLVVMVYHILLLFPPLVFWFLWLFAWGHEGDLQNAAIPFMAAVTLLAVVWGVWIITNMPIKNT